MEQRKGVDAFPVETSQKELGKIFALWHEYKAGNFPEKSCRGRQRTPSKTLEGSVEKIAFFDVSGLKSSTGGFKLYSFYFQQLIMWIGHFILGQFQKFLPLSSHFSTGPRTILMFTVEKAKVCQSKSLARNLLKCFAHLWTFLYEERIEPTNNLAERALYPCVILRCDTQKNFLRKSIDLGS